MICDPQIIFVDLGSNIGKFFQFDSDYGSQVIIQDMNRGSPFKK